MNIPPSYTLTPEIIELITKIEANRITFNTLNVPKQVKENIQRNQIALNNKV